MNVNRVFSGCEEASKILNKWICSATNDVKVTLPNEEQAKLILKNFKLTTNSILGTIVNYTGGIFIKSGIIRILGSGSKNFKRDLYTWNMNTKKIDKALIVADDIFGGIFAINGGKFNGDLGTVYYFAPDTLEWEDLNLRYSEFIYWTFSGDVKKFYEEFLWNNWEEEFSNIDDDKGISIYPFLWADGPDIRYRSKKIVDIQELY